MVGVAKFTVEKCTDGKGFEFEPVANQGLFEIYSRCAGN